VFIGLQQSSIADPRETKRSLKQLPATLRGEASDEGATSGPTGCYGNRRPRRARLLTWAKQISLAAVQIANPIVLMDAKRRAPSKSVYVWRAARAVVPILMGSGVAEGAGNSRLCELEFLLEAGLSTRKAARAATTMPTLLSLGLNLANFAFGSLRSFIVHELNRPLDIANVRRLSAAKLHARILNFEEFTGLRADPRFRNEYQYIEES